MTPIENEQERREVIRRIEHRYQEAHAKRLKAEAEVVQARQEEAALLNAQRRAQLPIPPGDICPECWVMHGDEHPLRPVPHPHDARHIDRWLCNVCRHVEDRETGL